MSLSVEVNTDIIDITDGEGESVATIHREQYGIVVRSKIELTDDPTGESVTCEAPVAFFAYTRQKLQDSQKFYDAVEQQLNRNLRNNSSSTLHNVWSTSRKAVEELEELESEGDTA